MLSTQSEGQRDSVPQQTLKSVSFCLKSLVTTLRSTKRLCLSASFLTPSLTKGGCEISPCLSLIMNWHQQGVTSKCVPWTRNFPAFQLCITHSLDSIPWGVGFKHSTKERLSPDNSQFITFSLLVTWNVGAGTQYLFEEGEQEQVRPESERVSLKDRPRQEEVSLKRHRRTRTEFHLKLGVRASTELVE